MPQIVSTTSPKAPPAGSPEPSILQSALLSRAGFSHGFFTREGGVTAGPWGTMNFRVGSGDTGENVAENLRRAAASLGISAESLFYPTQVHGIVALEAQRGDDRSAFAACEADTVLTRGADSAAAIRTADCVPILLAAPETGWVAACHSGWKGCVRGAVIEAVRQLQARKAGPLLAAIGPHISLTSFEVSPEVATELQQASVAPDIVDWSRARPHVDLRKMVRGQLRSVGLSDESIDDVLGCTYLEPTRFHSHRRDGEASGRLLSAIVGRD